MMEAFIGQDADYVVDWLVHQGLEKLMDVFKDIFSQFLLFFLLLRSNNLYYISISQIERLKTINPGAGHLPGSFIPTPGNLPIFFKEMLMPGG